MAYQGGSQPPHEYDAGHQLHDMGNPVSYTTPRLSEPQEKKS